jgi:hypothetical protein
MKCEEIESLITGYLDGGLDKLVKKEIEKHLETCEKCRDEISESRKMLELISDQGVEIPDESLRINFYHMLHNEIRKSGISYKGSHPGGIGLWRRNRTFLAAAGIALLVCGAFIGMLINSTKWSRMNLAQMEKIEAKITGMKKDAMLTLLDNKSSSFRLQGISYADELEQPGDIVIEALLKTLNNDKNVNVRMAAAYALSKFTDNRIVCDSLVASLPRQNDPILQVTMINILVEIHEESALKIIQQIMKNEQTLKEVRTVAENGARELML